MSGDRIIEEARKWLGTPYANYRRVRGIEGGVDCLNYMAGVFIDLGAMSHVPTKRYDRAFWLRHQDLLMEGIIEGIDSLKAGHSATVFDDVNAVRWERGDTLLVKCHPRLRHPNHAVFVDSAREAPQTWILHADSVRGDVRRDVMPRKWSPSHLVKVSLA